ncbi:MAG: Cytochrome c oxidase assembly protein CtaG [Alphaproteobacteria bacterium MarineAlpha2_Bin1]|nr:MAG: Cytochrome c oxidase assembly protein CtaG [Alphaproteobacteria bacterium MarineAlpha2_Bin1]|tara:strand:+ start:130 stop:756 length:627 start_codon:yes stop_codon:yes gene_type:complete
MKKVNRMRITALSSFLVVFIMVGAAYAAVPLYKLFCQVTGFAGTTQKANSLPTDISDRVIRVQFDANVGKNLPWDFSPLQREVSIKIGEEGIAFYTAKNLTNKHIKGSAVFNVTPPKAGYYFNKIDCFCFQEQTLAPGEEIKMPVTFFINPEIIEEPGMDDIKIITLSYTFFEQNDDNQDLKRDSSIDLFNNMLLKSYALRKKEPNNG